MLGQGLDRLSVDGFETWALSGVMYVCGHASCMGLRWFRGLKWLNRMIYLLRVWGARACIYGSTAV